MSTYHAQMVQCIPILFLKCQNVYMSCLDNLVQTHFVSKMAKMSICHAWMVQCIPILYLKCQNVYMSCLNNLVQTHLVSKMAKMSTCHAWIVQCRPNFNLRQTRCLHVMLGWFSVKLLFYDCEMYKVDGLWFMVFNTTCKYISVISLWSVLLMEGT